VVVGPLVLMASRGFLSCHDLLEDDLLGVMKEYWYVELTSGSRLSDLHAHGRHQYPQRPFAIGEDLSKGGDVFIHFRKFGVSSRSLRNAAPSHIPLVFFFLLWPPAPSVLCYSSYLYCLSVNLRLMNGIYTSSTAYCALPLKLMVVVACFASCCKAISGFSVRHDSGVQLRMSHCPTIVGLDR